MKVAAQAMRLLLLLAVAAEAYVPPPATVVHTATVGTDHADARPQVAAEFSRHVGG